MKNTTLLLTLITTFFITACGNSQNNATKIKKETTIEVVDAQKFNELITQGGTILDVRTPEEWAQGIIKGAVKMNFYDADFSKQIETLDKTQPIYVYCKAGGRSGKTAKQLEKLGFTKVYDLDGGIGAWDEAGYKKVK
ncbi:MAG: rhodanese-like domain-containing protein [Bacteroidetes bacterium HGW-Bacteroidetes-12]|nr:MAG: rhodanese-like domain-containing protein [Bacteroidetes bacterium HGW-Bacteroidetes-12]